jgi:RHS repeat-associated protein
MLRNGTAAAGQIAMDALSLHYNSLNNQLQFITDTVSRNNYSNDVDGSQPGNYKYDLSGNLTKDVSENIDSILWNSRGKIARIIKDGGVSSIDYTYSSLANRLSASSKGKTTYYITDVNGNIVATYIKDTSGLYCKEQTIYGTKRLGTFNKGVNANNTFFVKGNKQYELNDHLGNVLLTISDKKIPQDTDGDGIANYYTAEIVSAADYYPFGMQMPLRTVNDTAYRYGFNGKEKDDDVKGRGNQLDFGSRIYDSRLGRFLSIDPSAGAYPFLSPYLSSGNNPILYIDKYGEGPALPPPQIDKAMRENHPIAYKALLASNNTSPREFYLWVKTGKGNFNAFKGAFGEAEEYRRIEEGESHFHGNSSRGSIGYGSGGSPELGKKYEGYQIDVQETLASADIINLTGVITVRGYVDIHSSNINGRDNRRVFYGENEDVTFTLNYEVKNLSPMRSPETAIEYIEKGVDQAVDRTSKKDNAIGILVTDKQSWMNIYNRKDLRPRLEAAYKKLTGAGAYLQLEEDLSLKSEDELWKTWDSVKDAMKKKKSDTKEENEEK